MTDEEKMAVELDEQIEKEMCTELEEKENLLKEKEERYLRMYAEFENYKKRTEKENKFQSSKISMTLMFLESIKQDSILKIK